MSEEAHYWGQALWPIWKGQTAAQLPRSLCSSDNLREHYDANRLEIGVMIRRCDNDDDDIQYKNSRAVKEKITKLNY